MGAASPSAAPLSFAPEWSSTALSPSLSFSPTDRPAGVSACEQHGLCRVPSLTRTTLTWSENSSHSIRSRSASRSGLRRPARWLRRRARAGRLGGASRSRAAATAGRVRRRWRSRSTTIPRRADVPRSRRSRCIHRSPEIVREDPHDHAHVPWGRSIVDFRHSRVKRMRERGSARADGKRRPPGTAPPTTMAFAPRPSGRDCDDEQRAPPRLAIEAPATRRSAAWRTRWPRLGRDRSSRARSPRRRESRSGRARCRR